MQEGLPSLDRFSRKKGRTLWKNRTQETYSTMLILRIHALSLGSRAVTPMETSQYPTRQQSVSNSQRPFDTQQKLPEIWHFQILNLTEAYYQSAGCIQLTGTSTQAEVD